MQLFKNIHLFNYSPFIKEGNSPFIKKGNLVTNRNYLFKYYLNIKNIKNIFKKRNILLFTEMK